MANGLQEGHGDLLFVKKASCLGYVDGCGGGRTLTSYR